MSDNKRSKEYRANNNKSVVVPFRLTAAEKSDLETLAKADGYTPSDYIRKALKFKALRKRNNPAHAAALVEFEKLRRDHAGLSRNINQLAMIANKNDAISQAQINEVLAIVQRSADLVSKMDRLKFGDDDDGDHRD
jgi:hypothetical protein